jgi:hypothetical protein
MYKYLAALKGTVSRDFRRQMWGGGRRVKKEAINSCCCYLFSTLSLKTTTPALQYCYHEGKTEDENNGYVVIK